MMARMSEIAAKEPDKRKRAAAKKCRIFHMLHPQIVSGAAFRNGCPSGDI